jgi:anaerobic ribonucleoside-triphosphate reductase activating protein
VSQHAPPSLAERTLIAMNKAHFPVTVLGPGQRIGLWLQGCSVGCAGCVSQDTWQADASHRMPVAHVLAWCRQISQGQALDGVTISGGEPFEQPQALGVLLAGLQRWREQSGQDFDLLCYSGLPLARLEREHSALLAQLDALIPEPYVEKLPMTELWRGSANQRLVPLSERGRTRYAPYLHSSAAEGKRMQVGISGEHVWWIGLPERGDMQALDALCRQRGLRFGQPSWRAAAPRKPKP